MIQLYQNIHAKPWTSFHKKEASEMKWTGLHQPHLHLSRDMVCGPPYLYLRTSEHIKFEKNKHVFVMPIYLRVP